MVRVIAVIAILVSLSELKAQRLELMLGTERLFFDIQWFEKFDEAGKWTLFSRTRGSLDYQNNTDIFSGAYFEYTAKSGIGPTLLGRIASGGAGSELGIHFIKQIKNWFIYSLVSQEIRDELDISWFSIIRFTPSVTEKWKFYSSLELFTNFGADGHMVSVYRVRTGVAKGNYFFGLGMNTAILNTNPNLVNFGVFIKKHF